jgi:chromosome partitioning protein
MSRVIAIANLKGGCGKTTIALNLACELNAEASTVLIDADGQSTASMWCELGQMPVAHEKLPIDTPKTTDRWIQKIRATGQAKGFVIIDCPPAIGATTAAAVALADIVLIPVCASSADLAATETAIALVGRARANRADGGPLCLIVPSRIDRRTSSGREIGAALKRFGEPIAPAIYQRAAFVDSLGSGYWIGEYAPNGPAHQDIAALSAAVRKLLK